MERINTRQKPRGIDTNDPCTTLRHPPTGVVLWELVTSEIPKRGKMRPIRWVGVSRCQVMLGARAADLASTPFTHSLQGTGGVPRSGG